MALSNRIRLFTLLNRELQEYRTSLVLTPLVVGAALVVLMLVSVVFANRIAVLGDGLLGILAGEEAQGINLQIQVDNEGKTHILHEEASTEVTEPTAAAEPLQQLVIKDAPGELPDADWNFSQEWTFSPPHRQNQPSSGSHDHVLDSLNPVFMGLHNLFMFLMFLVTVNYLLGSLYTDRKDRSILFWKSMPVSEWHEVLCKLGVGSLIVPVVFVAASMVTQVLTIALAMLLVWRMDGAPVEMVLNNVQFVSLLGNQIGAAVVWSLWTVPAYAWFLLASSAAKRSPFLLAFAVPVGLVIAEEILFGTAYIIGSMSNHLPHLIDGDDARSMGLYVYGPVWSSLDYVGMLLGFGFAAAALAGAVWLRRYRFEI